MIMTILNGGNNVTNEKKKYGDAFEKNTNKQSGVVINNYNRILCV